MKKMLLLTLTCIALTVPAFAQSNPIKIGLIHVLSGPMQTWGLVSVRGAKMAADEINAKGGINGRKVVVVAADSKLKPDIAVKEVTRMVKEEKVDIVIGTVSSAVAKKITPLMNNLECPLIVTHAMTNDITGSLCNKWAFRLTWSNSQCYKSAALLAKDSGRKKWISVGPDYGFGQESWKQFSTYLKELVPDVSYEEPIFTPVSTKDWSKVLDRIRKSPTDGVMLSLWGDNLKSFIRQGMKTTELFKSGKLILCPVGGSAEVFINLGIMDMPQGIVFGAPYWFDAYDNPANNKFVSDYRKLSRSAKAPPSYAASIPYSAVKIYKNAVEKAGTTDKASVAKALAGLVVDNLPVGTVTLREGDHQAIFTVVFGQSEGIDTVSKILRNMSHFRYFNGEDVTPPVAECGCALASGDADALSKK